MVRWSTLPLPHVQPCGVFCFVRTSSSSVRCVACWAGTAPTSESGIGKNWAAFKGSIGQTLALTSALTLRSFPARALGFHLWLVLIKKHSLTIVSTILSTSMLSPLVLRNRFAAARELILNWALPLTLSVRSVKFLRATLLRAFADTASAMAAGNTVPLKRDLGLHTVSSPRPMIRSGLA
jgi:hypothetical protein